jgi:hypothetical protein
MSDPDRSLSLQWSEVPTVTDDLSRRDRGPLTLGPGRYRAAFIDRPRRTPIVSERDIEIVE